MTISRPNQIALLRPRTFGPKQKQSACNTIFCLTNQNVCFRSYSKQTKSKRFAFIPIISFDIETFVLAFRIVDITTLVLSWNFKESIGSRNRGGIGLSYRPARLHRLAELIPWNRFLGSLTIRALTTMAAGRWNGAQDRGEVVGGGGAAHNR
jgi:hypothetical protein